MENIETLRQHLDSLDHQIVRLLNMRMMVAEKIADWKTECHAPLTDKGREEQVIEFAQETACHPILKEHIEKIYPPIMDCAKAVQVLKHAEFPIKNIGIIGLGLMGGSLAKALKTKDPHIHLHTVNDVILEKEVEESSLIESKLSLEELVNKVDLLLLATPISTTLLLAEKIAQYAKKPLYVIDIASVKEEIVKSFEKFSNLSVEFIATHPMAGREKSGFQHSKASLFVCASWIVVPHGKNTSKGLETVQHFIEYVGAWMKVMTPDQHDQKTALISHLPALISTKLLKFATETDSTALEIAGPGFKSVTRLAHANPHLHAEIFASNRSYIEMLLASFLKEAGKP